jgi:hypothetical protein
VWRHAGCLARTGAWNAALGVCRRLNWEEC